MSSGFLGLSCIKIKLELTSGARASSGEVPDAAITPGGFTHSNFFGAHWAPSKEEEEEEKESR